jgi:transposase
VFEDEASFRQTPTLYQTWARLGCQPQVLTRGERNTQKVFGAVALAQAQFVYRHQTEYFHHESYVAFLDEVVLPRFYRRGHRVYLIQDNASYHKQADTYAWFARQRRYLEVFQLPPYWPQLNATERIWHHTRMAATHNRYFERPEALRDALLRTFEDIRRHPAQIRNLLMPFC